MPSVQLKEQRPSKFNPLIKFDSSFCVAGGGIWVTYVNHCKVSLIILMAHVITEGSTSYTTLVIAASFSILSVRKSVTSFDTFMAP